jgi:hypothetical protein
MTFIYNKYTRNPYYVKNYWMFSDINSAHYILVLKYITIQYNEMQL